MISRQETFDTVVAGARTQGCKSMLDGKCKFRGDNGTKCFVGMLIPDEEYDPSFDSALIPRVYDRCPSLQQHDAQMLGQLQSIHDQTPVDQWEDEFKRFAERTGLRYDEPTSV